MTRSKIRSTLIRCFIALLLAAATPLYAQKAAENAAPTAQGYENETKAQRDARMAWWRDARFGMFIHWGPYAVPGGERNGEICGGGAEWIMDKLDYTIEDYEKEVVDQFNPVDFDADAWAEVAKQAGMKYLVITAKHHDGFCMWDTKTTDFGIMNTPYGKDIVKEYVDACRRHGIKVGYYFSPELRALPLGSC